MKQWIIMSVAFSAILWASPVAQAGGHTDSSHKEHTVGPYFISPKNGETVAKEFTIKMGIACMKVQKAGELTEGTGHHHLIIDGGFVPETEAVIKDAKHMHFGKGQTETKITLSPGKHTLTLQFADGYHQSYGKVMSKSIEVIVK